MPFTIQPSLQHQSNNVLSQPIISVSLPVAPPTESGTPTQRKCWNCRHDRKGCKPSKDQSTCEWCKQNNYPCTYDEPAAKRRRTLAIQKCQQCRNRKQKCLPENRVWPEKCDECKKHNDECSEPQAPNRTRTKQPQMQASQQLGPSVSDGQSNHGHFPLPIGTPDAGQRNRAIGTGPSSVLCDLDSGPTLPGAKTKEGEAGKDGRKSQDSVWASSLVYLHTRSDSEPTIIFAGEPISTGRIFGSNLGQDRIEELGYLAWLWTKLKPTEKLFKKYDPEIETLERNTLWTWNFVRLFKRVYRNALQSSGLMPTSASTDEYLDTRSTELTEYHYPFSDIALQPAELKNVANLSRMVDLCQSAGDFLMTQTLLERLFQTITEQIDSDKPSFNSDAISIARILIEIYRKVSERLESIARRLDLNINMVMGVVPLIHRAVVMNNRLLMSTILDQAETTSNTDFVGRNAVHIAMEHRASESLDVLWKSGHGETLMLSSDFFGRRPIHIAAEIGFVDCIRVIPIPPSHFENHRGSELWKGPLAPYNDSLQAAARNGHLEMVKLLLADGLIANTPVRRRSGRTALQVAVEGGHIEVVKILLESGAEVNAEPAEINGKTALQVAAERGSLQLMSLLLANGAAINASPSDSGGRTALQAAAEKGHLEICLRLVLNGALINDKPARFEGRTALQAAAEGGHAGVVLLLLDKGAHVNTYPAQGGVTALQAAVKSGNTEIIQLLISKGADINAVSQCQGSRTALQAAAETGNREIFDLLLMMGARINTYEGTSHTSALQAAAQGGHLEIVQEILKRGAHVNIRSPANLLIGAALPAASAEGHAEIVQLLLCNGADISFVAPNTGGFTTSALQAAARNGHLDIVNMLLAARADVNAEGSSYFGATALQAAAANGHLEIANVLLNNGADVNGIGSHGGEILTVLESAIEYGHVGIIRQLLEYRVIVKNKEIALAESTGNLVVVDILKAYKEPNEYAEV